VKFLLELVELVEHTSDGSIIVVRVQVLSQVRSNSSLCCSSQVRGDQASLIVIIYVFVFKLKEEVLLKEPSFELVIVSVEMIGASDLSGFAIGGLGWGVY
jgi:hypothetical protein